MRCLIGAGASHLQRPAIIEHPRYRPANDGHADQRLVVSDSDREYVARWRLVVPVPGGYEPAGVRELDGHKLQTHGTHLPLSAAPRVRPQVPRPLREGRGTHLGVAASGTHLGRGGTRDALAVISPTP
jgi:hypothetical protein